VFSFLETFKYSAELSNIMQNKSALLANLFDAKTVEVLKKLLIKQDIFYLRDLSRETNVSLATTFRIVQKLAKLGLVAKEQKDKFTFYTLVKDSPAYKELYTLIIGASPDPISALRKGLESKYGSDFLLYLLKGKEKKIFVISDKADSSNVRDVVDAVSNKIGNKINHIVLKTAQFEQMKDMGLIDAGKLEVI